MEKNISRGITLRCGKYCLRFKRNKKTITVGTFNTLEEAEREREIFLADYEKEKLIKRAEKKREEAMMGQDCFANREGICTALKVKKCKGCKFYKTVEEVTRQVEKCRARCKAIGFPFGYEYTNYAKGLMFKTSKADDEIDEDVENNGFFNEKLYKALEDYGDTYSMIGKEIGVGKNTISAWLYYEKYPKEENRERLKTLLGIENIDELFPKEKYPNKGKGGRK